MHYWQEIQVGPYAEYLQRQGQDHLDRAARQADFFVGLAQRGIDRIGVAVVAIPLSGVTL